ncbi:MAG: PilZ domain-containing protein [Deltaproteobacteria bacterium]|nr:PilZ domain-containing protein [Deltaproteobacteria bacterium]
MKRKSREGERRTFKRLEVPIPLSMKLLGMFGTPSPINAEARNVSLDGLSTELKVILKDGRLLIQEGEEPIKLIPYLVLNEKMVELDIKTPPQGETIRAIGRVIWYDFGSRESLYYFKAGIFLEKMEMKDRKKWEEFVRNIA